MTSGAEDLMRVSRLALFDNMFRSPLDDRVTRILETLIALLEGSYKDDRQATPLLETIAFVLEQYTELGGGSGRKLPSMRLWNVVRKAHFKSTNIRKLEAAVKIYESLAVQGDMRKNALGKLNDLLLHPYPNVGR